MGLLRFFLILFSVFGGGSLAFAVSGPELDQQAREVYDSVMSPYCPGMTLSSCASDAARELRLEVREMLARGEKPEEVKAYLLRRFGDDLGGMPKGRRFGVWGLITPFLFVLLGLGALIAMLRKRTAETPQKLPAQISDDVRAKIERELQERLMKEEGI